MLLDLFARGEPLDWPRVPVARLAKIILDAAKAVEGKRPSPEVLFDDLDRRLRMMDLDPVSPAARRDASGGRPPIRLADELRSAVSANGRREDTLRRLRVLVKSLDDPAVAELVRQRAVDRGSSAVLLDFFAPFAALTDALTVERLAGSPFRAEEFARKWIDALGGRPEGETPEEAFRRLEELDYGKAMADLVRARKRKEAHARRVREIEERRAQNERERYMRE